MAEFNNAGLTIYNYRTRNFDPYPDSGFAGMTHQQLEDYVQPSGIERLRALIGAGHSPLESLRHVQRVQAGLQTQ